MDPVAKINDPQCELLLLCACTGISKLYFAMRTSPPRVFELAQRSFDVVVHSALEHIITASGLGFGDCLLHGLGDIYGDHVVSCVGIVGIKHRHNVVRDTLVDICYQFGISSGKEVGIALGEERDKSLRPADVLLYSWDGGCDLYVDLTSSSPLTQTGMVDFVSSRAVLEATQGVENVEGGEYVFV
ncbi:hypothetical protein Tco_0335083 [Tanacetum coccineum]